MLCYDIRNNQSMKPPGHLTAAASIGVSFRHPQPRFVRLPSHRRNCLPERVKLKQSYYYENREKSFSNGHQPFLISQLDISLSHRSIRVKNTRRLIRSKNRQRRPRKRGPQYKHWRPLHEVHFRPSSSEVPSIPSPNYSSLREES